MAAKKKGSDRIKGKAKVGGGRVSTVRATKPAKKSAKPKGKAKPDWKELDW
jgi:hypothetical protein